MTTPEATTLSRTAIPPRKSSQATTRSRSTDAEINLRNFRFQPKSGALTPTRFLVAQMVCCGLADKEIGHLLGIASQTVKFHVSQAMRTLGLQRRTQLVRYMFETKQFDPDEATAELKLYLVEKSRKSAKFTHFADLRHSPGTSL